ncbi:hypothetical protein GCM10010348_70200 [Streptomyces anthocyanicus]|uniref:hypothetical protein n=1 Tax=Streptomyces anthocyanicus TaxID=68174 RepID=UPI001873AB65|nr:hypothetical protein [Streptomyces anthocyanicus]GHC33221.1 hypothetical protein GCM10010348_70200 [Streptomyces anthocyanicus]
MARRPSPGTLRSAGFTVLLAVVFVMVNSQVVYAADSSETGDLLAPLNIRSSEGVPINGYELNAEGGSIVAFKTQALAFALSGLFTLIRLLVGLAGWAIEVAFRFPLLKILARPAQEVADAYNEVVVDALGLRGLLLAWAFVFAAFMLVRGRVSRGLGEIFLTLLIAAFAASAFVRPDYLLAADGPLGQAQQVGAEVAQRSVNAYDWGGKIASKSPCDGMAGRQELKCTEERGKGPVPAAEVARPIQDSVTNALIVKPYMLLQYGRILDPAKEADRKAYAVHLRWISGGYKAGKTRDSEAGEDPCDRIKGPGKAYCERGEEGGDRSGEDLDDSLPSSFGPGSELLNEALVPSEEEQEFSAFLADLKKAGDVGEACAGYAEKPTWWRVGGALLLLIGALFICGMLLSSAIVLLGTQGMCAAAAVAGGVAFIAGILPGPARQSVWKWLSLWGIAVGAVVGICAFIPFFGIAVDATITNGPDLMVERILLIDVLAIAGAAGHRRLLTGIASFGRRMAMRMRYAKVGGTHLPGDTSELGATLAMHFPTALGGYSAGGGLRALTGGGGGRFGMLGTRQRLLGALGSLVDGAGMPVDTGRLLSDATTEAGRGLAPLTAAAALGGAGARLGAKGGYGLLIGRHPDREQLAKWRKPTAAGDPGNGGPHAGTPGAPDRPGGPGSGGGAPRPGGQGPLRPGGPPDRYRNEDGEVVDRRTGQVLHDQNSDHTLLSTRAHNRLVRFRGYRLLHRGGRTAYAASVGLPASVGKARSQGSRFSRDARQQVQVWGNTLREDGRAWTATGRHVGRVLQEHAGDRGGSAPFTGRRLPPASTRRDATSSEVSPHPSAPPTSLRPSTASRGLSDTARPGGPQSGGRAEERLATPSARRTGSEPMPQRDHGGPVLPGGGRARSQAREEARERMRELMRRTAPDAERLRSERSRPDDQSGEGGEQG